MSHVMQSQHKKQFVRLIAKRMDFISIKCLAYHILVASYSAMQKTNKTFPSARLDKINKHNDEHRRSAMTDRGKLILFLLL